MLIRRTLLPLPKPISVQKRTFIPFSHATAALGALTSLTSAPKPLHYHATRTLPYPKTSLYDIVSDIQSYPRFLPLVHDAQVLAYAQFPQIQIQNHGQTSKQTTTTQQQPQQQQQKKSPLLPALATLEIGLPRQAQSLPGFPNSTLAFISNVYCAPGRGIVEAVAGDERASKFLSAAELRENGYGEQMEPQAETQQAEAGAEKQQQQHAEIKDIGPEIFRVCRTRWLLGELGPHKTEVDLRIEIEWKNHVFAALTQAMAVGVADVMVEAFERRAREMLRGS